MEIPTSTPGVQVFTYSAREYREKTKVLEQARTDAISDRSVRRRGGAEVLLDEMKAVWHDDLIS